MMFEDWWKQCNYSEHHKEECRKAYNAGEEDNFLHANREINNRDVIINFLKKELLKKSYCRQVMKRQYRELKQKYDALLEKEGKKMIEIKIKQPEIRFEQPEIKPIPRA